MVPSLLNFNDPSVSSEDSVISVSSVTSVSDTSAVDAGTGILFPLFEFTRWYLNIPPHTSKNAAAIAAVLTIRFPPVFLTILMFSSVPESSVISF